MKKSGHSEFDRILAALSYLFILAVIPFVFGHHKPFVAQHAKQGMILLVLELILFFVVAVPVLGWVIFPLGWLFVVICSIIGLSHALAGKDWEIPFVHKILNK